MKHLFLRLGVSVALLLGPLAAAAATVTFNSVKVPMGKTYTVTGDFTSATLNESGQQLTVTVAQNETITIVSPDTTKLAFDTSAVPSFTETCGSSTYQIVFTKTTSGSQTFSVNPSSNTCSTATPSSTSSGGGGSGGGGGGGGGPLAPAPAPAPAAAPAAPTPPAAFGITSGLSLGSESSEVAQLQAYLASDKSIYPEGLITGYFGPKTQAAVRRFQAKYGLPQVGRVGPLTRAKLAEIFAAPASAPAPAPAPAPAGGPLTRFLSRGSRGDDVSTLQSLLAGDPEIYPEGLVTGYFGLLTESAVKRFQAKYGIQALGIIGPATRAKVNELLGAAPAPTPAPAPVPIPSAADDAAKIKALQDQLKALQEQLLKLQNL